MSNEENSYEKETKIFWRNLAVQYKYFVVLFGLIVLGAVIAFLLTVGWYIDNSPIGGKGTWTFDQFSMGSMVEFGIFFVLYLLLFVALPVAILAGSLVGILWFVVFSPELKEELKLRNKKEEERKKKYGRKSEGGGAFGFFMFVGVCIYIVLDGHWDTEFGSLNIGYFAGAWIAVFIWVALIFSIVALAVLAWYYKKYDTKE